MSTLQREHTDALIAALEATSIAIGDANDRTVDGDLIGGWQGPPGESEFRPYAIVYPLPGGTFDGTLADPDDDADLLYQITCVGGTRQQCEWVADQIHDVLTDPGTVTVPGRSVVRVVPDMAGGVRRDDTVRPPVFIATPRFRLWTTPV